MVSDFQRHLRIPLFAEVQACGDRVLGTMYAWNISDGGLYLKVSGVSANDVPLGDQLDLAFCLPDGGPRVEVCAEVVWVDPDDQSGVGLGLRFQPLTEPVAEHIRRFIDSFSYRVIALGFDALDVAERAIGDLYQMMAVRSEGELAAAITHRHVGLILLGEREGADATLQRVQRIIESTPNGPPILYCGQYASKALALLIAKHERISYARMPIEPLEFRGLVQRAVQLSVMRFENELLTGELGRAVERLRQENQFLRASLREPEQPAGMVGSSTAMRRVFERIEQVAPVSTSVIIFGETGTGKELVARAIHALSARADRAFVAQNCAALVESLLDSELFGHTRGAYTGATQERPGLFEAANGGTVFLDEVGDMSQAMQAKLLRVLQDGEIRRVGENKSRRVDVRVICATHRDLETLVKEKVFREDLYYRLRTFVVSLPPLRQRREDIAALAMHFLERFAALHRRPLLGFTREAMHLLEVYDWPGNVRHLQHTVELLVVLAGKHAKIDADLVRQSLGANTQENFRTPKRGLKKALDDHERGLILAALERSGGVISRAALLLGIERTTLSKRCKRLAINDPQDQG